MKRSAIALVLLAAFAFTSWGAYLESDTEKKHPGGETAPPPRTIIPRRPDSPLLPLIMHIRVGDPISRYGLTFFPLLLRRGVADSEVLTLDEALERDVLMVRESGTAAVPRVRVRNDARLPVFLMAGEIIVGGKQNRIIRDDVLLPARSDFVDVPVYCGEQDRWTDGDKAFKSGGLTAPSLRKMAADAASQERVWREIEGHLGGAEVKSSTRNYQEIYEDESTRRRLDECVAAFRGFCRADTVGCVAVSRGHVLGCDVFSDRDLLAKLWDKICRSYAAEAVIPYGPAEIREEEHRPARGGDAVRRFLDSIVHARFRDRPTPGIGRCRTIGGPVSGHVLEYRETVLHAGVFPAKFRIRPHGEGGR